MCRLTAYRYLSPGRSILAQTKSRSLRVVSSHSPYSTMGQRLTMPLGMFALASGSWQYEKFVPKV